MPNSSFTRISETEIDFTDPITGGIWKIIAPHRISENGALIAIEQVLEEQNIQPAKGGTLTVHFSIKVQEEGDKAHPIFGDILAQIAELRKKRFE